MPLAAAVLDQIHAFLETPVEASPAGQWGEVRASDRMALLGLVQALIAAKYTPDREGEFPFSVHVVDRTRFVAWSFQLMPHAPPRGLDECHDRLRVALANVSLAQNQLRQASAQFEALMTHTVQPGLPLQVGEHTYIRAHPGLDATALGQAAETGLKAYCDRQPPALATPEERLAWQSTASACLSQELGVPVRVRLPAGEPPLQVVVELLCLGPRKRQTDPVVRGRDRPDRSAQERTVKWGIRTPSLRKSLAARTSLVRQVQQRLGLRASRGWGRLNDPHKALYNRAYPRTTFSLVSLIRR